jgi:D-alanine-D-alanine ligase
MIAQMIGQAPPRTHARVAVLMGGWSAEREISLRSGTAVASALSGEGYKVSTIDVGRDLAARLAEIKPDVCFNALHGRFGEDGCVQGLLECLAIPYTHSGVLASALAMHKERAKDVMGPAGVPVADAEVVTRREALERHVLAPPYVVKPVAEGSSVGVVIVHDGANRPPEAIAQGGGLDDLVMVERYIPGRELTCAVIGDFVSDVIEIVPQKGLAFYDYEAKYAPGGSRHALPADISPDVYQLVRKYTLAACRALGCRGAARADFRYDDTTAGAGELICLEVNTQPGMTETSLVPELAQHAGWSFGELVRWLVEDASCNR